MTGQALLKAVLEFIELACNPNAGDRLYDGYAKGALLFFEGQLRQKRTLSPADFARYFLEASLAMARPLLTLNGLVSHKAEAGGALGWFQVSDGAHDFFLAVGFQDEGSWKIDWLTLAEAQEPWDDALGRSQMLADFPYAQSCHPRTWLDAAHYRLYSHEKPVLKLLEGARFTCQGSTVCCKIDHAIEVDDALQAVVDAIPWEHHQPALKGIQLKLLANGKREVKQRNESCRFLDEFQRCSLHKALGRPLFPPCARFPFSFVETPDGVAVGASAVCGSVRGNVGEVLSARKTDLYRRLAIAKDAVLRPRVFRLKPGLAITWEHFIGLETSLLAHLDRTDLPLDRRLWLGSLLLANQTESPVQLPAGIEQTPWTLLPLAEREAIHLFLLDFLLGFAPAPWPLLAPNDSFKPDTLIALMCGLIHSKIYSVVFNLATAHNLCILLYLLALHLENRHGSPWPDGPWIQLGKIFHQGGLLHALKDPNEKARDQRAMLGDPAFGLWLLGYLER
jgi:hypothetical protein